MRLPSRSYLSRRTSALYWRARVWLAFKRLVQVCRVEGTIVEVNGAEATVKLTDGSTKVIELMEPVVTKAGDPYSSETWMPDEGYWTRRLLGCVGAAVCFAIGYRNFRRP